MTLPALVLSPDFLPGHDRLNGRRWAAQLLLRLWAQAADHEPLHFLGLEPGAVQLLDEPLRHAGFRGAVQQLPITDPEALAPVGALFLPDPSIGTWASWRQATGAHRFSLIGQIHTLSTTAALGMLDALVYEPVQSWDALICTSSAGRAVVQALWADRASQLQHRFGGHPPAAPQMPVIPLPLAAESFQLADLCPHQARVALDLPAEAAVVLWLGRLSMLTKADPWPAYQVLNRVAQQLQRPLVLLECGPDDTPEQAAHFSELRQHCPAIQFRRLGGGDAVPETLKQKALAASDLLLSLVDNVQETFGLSVVEALAAGKPVVAADWDGYRDLVQDGVDGFLVSSRWAEPAAAASFPLGWIHRLQLSSFPHISGTLAQLVQLDLAAAAEAVLTVLSNPALARAMGRAARQRAQQRFSASVVMAAYQELFAELEQRRSAATLESAPMPPLRLDPVRCFAGFACGFNPLSIPIGSSSLPLPRTLIEARSPFEQQLRLVLPQRDSVDVAQAFARKHGGPWQL